MSFTLGFGYFVKIIELQVFPGKSTPLEHFVLNKVSDKPCLNIEIALPVLSSLCIVKSFSDEIRLFTEGLYKSMLLFSFSDGRSWKAFTCISVGFIVFSIQDVKAFRYSARVCFCELKFEYLQSISFPVFIISMLPCFSVSASTIL